MKLRRAGIITILVVAALVVYASITLISLNTRIDTALTSQEELRQQVAEKQVSNESLRYAVENSEDDETKADIARGSLGLVAPDEKIFYDSGN